MGSSLSSPCLGLGQEAKKMLGLSGFNSTNAGFKSPIELTISAFVSAVAVAVNAKNGIDEKMLDNIPSFP
jgi:hypothetical protein